MLGRPHLLIGTGNANEDENGKPCLKDRDCNRPDRGPDMTMR